MTVVGVRRDQCEPSCGALGYQSGDLHEPVSERTGEPKTRAHPVRPGGSSRRSEEAILATSLAGSRGGRLVHRGMSSRGRPLVLLRMSYLASPARLLRTSPTCAGRLTLMSEVKGRGSDLAFRLTAGRFLVMVIGCTGSEMER